MAEIRQYVEILQESLEKKKKVLQTILEENTKQEEVLKKDGGMEEFDNIVKTKGRLLRELKRLDKGFEKVYDRVKETLPEEKESYKDEIACMQRLISEITDLSVRIQTSEQRNKQLVENYFSHTKGKIRQAKMSVRVASNYYKSMSGANYVGVHLMDRKK